MREDEKIDSDNNEKSIETEAQPFSFMDWIRLGLVFVLPWSHSLDADLQHLSRGVPIIDELFQYRTPRRNLL